MNVLFVSESRRSRTLFRDESTRYRCHHMAEGLHTAGILADVTTLASLDVANLSRYDVISFQQPSASRKLLTILERCQKLNIRTVADIDALEFDPTLAKYARRSQNNSHSEASVRLSFMRQSLALQHFDDVSTATESIAQRRRAIAPQQNVYVVPNGLSTYWIESHNQIDLAAVKSQRIGYLPICSDHSIDFAQAAKSVFSYLKGCPQRELYTAGLLTTATSQIPCTQWVQTEGVDFTNLPNALSSCRVRVAPQPTNCLGYAQTHTQFIEAAAFGVPTISSPCADLMRHKVPGLQIAGSNDEWLQCLLKLSDETYYQKCRKALYEYAHDSCLARDSAKLLIKHWNTPEKQSYNETATTLSAAG